MVVSERVAGDQGAGEKCDIPVHLYHGGLTGSITSFHWASHFGTRDQALFAILAKGIRDNYSNVSSTPYLYECKHSLQAGDVSKMSRDWGSPLHGAALYTYLRTLGRMDEQRAIWEKYGLSDPSHNDLALSLLKEVMLDDHCKALSYRNLVEGSALSYMILNPTDVVNIVQIIPCKDELNDAFNHNFQKLVHRNSQVAHKLMAEMLMFCPPC
ncbi:hypothetical protein [Pseudomonas syringae group genomosp. 3]|uniref:hypothetical protein n=1 Tax=Pseudomonas syringae group genomosp. 3 TaxID=251701 RepID=UPI000EFF0961|nr:hypothetical protein [Pseudomonas syringae group genomosp. 3]